MQCLHVEALREGGGALDLGRGLAASGQVFSVPADRPAVGPADLLLLRAGASLQQTAESSARDLVCLILLPDAPGYIAVLLRSVGEIPRHVHDLPPDAQRDARQDGRHEGRRQDPCESQKPCGRFPERLMISQKFFQLLRAAGLPRRLFLCQLHRLGLPLPLADVVILPVIPGQPGRHERHAEQDHQEGEHFSADAAQLVLRHVGEALRLLQIHVRHADGAVIHTDQEIEGSGHQRNVAQHRAGSEEPRSIPKRKTKQTERPRLLGEQRPLPPGRVVLQSRSGASVFTEAQAQCAECQPDPSEQSLRLQQRRGNARLQAQRLRIDDTRPLQQVHEHCFRQRRHRIKDDSKDRSAEQEEEPHGSDSVRRDPHSRGQRQQAQAGQIQREDQRVDPQLKERIEHRPGEHDQHHRVQDLEKNKFSRASAPHTNNCV